MLLDMGTNRRLVLVLLLALSAMVLLARLLAAPLLHPALGFAAKVSCSGVLLGGATLAQVLASFPDERLRRAVRVYVDAEPGRATASVPLLGSRQAVQRAGLGCTLEPVRGDIAAAAPPALARPDDTSMPWLEGEAPEPDDAFDAARVAALIDGAFATVDGAATRTLALIIVHEGRIVAERYAEGFTPAHRFPGWSMAKSVTNALAGILAGDRRLDLDAAELRAEWHGRGDDRARITLRQLLHMSSGLDFDESYTPTGGATRMLFNSADVAATAAQSRLAHEPGTHWHYSSATTNIISAHLRVLFDDDDDYLGFPARRLFGPVGMRSAVLEPDAAGTFVGSSFMYATARDWARFGMLFVRDGVWNGNRILPEGWVAWSTTPAPAAPRGEYGAHWWLNAGSAADSTRRIWPDLPREMYWASGFQGQYVVLLPSHDIVVVRLGADHERGWGLGDFMRGLLAARPQAEPACGGPAVPAEPGVRCRPDHRWRAGELGSPMAKDGAGLRSAPRR
jgi:CubicO group peptidase (beta-lactamase class C family)